MIDCILPKEPGKNSNIFLQFHGTIDERNLTVLYETVGASSYAIRHIDSPPRIIVYFAGDRMMRLRKMTFDPMGAAVDWLDAYRAGDVEAILQMYADDAVVDCGCSGMKIVTGKAGLRAYWFDRLRKFPAGNLDDIHPSSGGTRISYVTEGRVVSAVLSFDAKGKIAALRCGPSRQHIISCASA